MRLAAFDTLKFVEKLEKGGFSKEQAKSMAEAQREVVMEITEGNLATKTDLIKLENKIDNLRSEFLGKYALHNWMIGFNLVISIGILLKLFH